MPASANTRVKLQTKQPGSCTVTAVSELLLTDTSHHSSSPKSVKAIFILLLFQALVYMHVPIFFFSQSVGVKSCWSARHVAAALGILLVLDENQSCLQVSAQACFTHTVLAATDALASWPAVKGPHL